MVLDQHQTSVPSMNNKIKQPQYTNKITTGRDNIQQRSVLIKKDNKILIIKSSIQPQSLNSINSIQQPQQKKHRLNGFSFITLQISFMICYGIAGFYYVQIQPTRLTYNEIISIIMLGIFAVLGFGLVLSVYRCASWLGIVTALLVFAIFIQLSPILQSLWFGSLIDPYTNFEQKKGVIIGQYFMYKNISETQANSKLFIQHFVKGLYDKIKLSSYSFRVTFLSIVSFLTFMTAVIARLTHLQTIKTAIIFQILWSLNFFLLIYFAFVKSNSYWNVIVPFFFDTYGSSYVYLFASFFGLAYTIIVNRDIPPINHNRNVLHGPAWLMSSIGTALIFVTFVFSYNNLIVYYNSQGKYYGENFKHMHIIFALLGSVVCTYVGSMLANKGRITYKQALVGTISGGISIGSAAPFIPNIGIALAIGSAGGLISGLITQKIHSRINKHFQYDTLGLFGPFLVSSLIGSLIVPTAILAYYQNRVQKIDTSGFPYVINSQKNERYYSKQLITYQLIYAGISAAMGLAGGIISGLLCRWDKDSFGMLSNGRFFYNDFGLFTAEQIKEQRANQQTMPMIIQNAQKNPNGSASLIIANPL